MDNCINCHYVKTPEMHKELRWRTLNWPLLVTVSAVTITMISVLVTLGIYGISVENTLMSIYCFVAASIFFFPSLQIPWVVILHMKMPKKFGQVDMVFHDDRIEIKDKTNSDSRAYSCVEKIKETPDFFLIIFKNEKKELSFLPVKKDALNCDSATFKEFVAGKIGDGKDKRNG